MINFKALTLTALTALTIAAPGFAATQWNAADYEYDRWHQIGVAAAEVEDWDTACTAMANLWELKDVVTWIKPGSKGGFLHNAGGFLEACRADGDASTPTISAAQFGGTTQPTNNTQITQAQAWEMLNGMASPAMTRAEAEAKCAQQPGVGNQIKVVNSGLSYSCSGYQTNGVAWNHFVVPAR